MKHRASSQTWCRRTRGGGLDSPVAGKRAQTQTYIPKRQIAVPKAQHESGFPKTKPEDWKRLHRE